MKFAILLQHYFPYGGLQRDAARLATAGKKAGDSPTLVVSTWDGPKPDGIPVIELHSGGSSNHSMAAHFSSDCQPLLASGEYETAIGFSRVSGIPYYFCGDACFLEKFSASKPSLSRHLPRYRYYLDIEKKLFNPDSPTHIFFLAPREMESYQHHYHLSPHRFTALPPWLNPPESFLKSPQEIRQRVFKELNLKPDNQLLLFVGSNFKLKQLNNLIEALPHLDDSIHLAVCGRDKPSPPRKLAKTLDVSHRVHLMGPRDDIPEWMIASDLLVHPSSRETAGMVLIEALSYGLPVTCTARCGYANYVEEAGGTLLTQDCPPEEIASVTHQMLDNLPTLRQKALDWASHPDRYQTAHLILQSMRKNLQ